MGGTTFSRRTFDLKSTNAVMSKSYIIPGERGFLV